VNEVATAASITIFRRSLTDSGILRYIGWLFGIFCAGLLFSFRVSSHDSTGWTLERLLHDTSFLQQASPALSTSWFSGHADRFIKIAEWLQASNETQDQRLHPTTPVAAG